MNKKVIFIPLMLLFIQPNKILGAAADPTDNLLYQDVRTIIMGRKKNEPVLNPQVYPIEGWFISDNETVQLLLNEFVNNEEEALRRADSLDLIFGHSAYDYPGRTIELVTEEELGKGIKGD